MRLFRPFCIAALLYPEALFRMETSDKILYLTFDDGPDPESTPGLLDILHDLKIRALFFCNGRAAEKYPSLISRIKSEGHVIGNHGYNHLNGWQVSCQNYCADINLASSFTSDKLFRPPFGRISFRQYRVLRKSFRIFFWDLMAYDFDQILSAGKSLEILTSKIRPGSIIVLHDTPGSACRYFLKDFVEASLKKGYRFEVTE